MEDIKAELRKKISSLSPEEFEKEVFDTLITHDDEAIAIFNEHNKEEIDRISEALDPSAIVKKAESKAIVQSDDQNSKTAIEKKN